jgi:hypothetical protein
MSTPQVRIEFDDERLAFEPGGRLRARCLLDPAPDTAVTSYEWSVFWRTEGKGDEDMEVITADEDSDGVSAFDPGHSEVLDLPLPLSPLSYDGLIVKIRWFVAVRVEVEGAAALEDEAEFQLGAVAVACEVKK